MQRKTIAAAIFALFAFIGQANAQSTSPVLLPGGCGTGNATNSLAYLTVDSTLKLCVNATVSASVSGFHPTASLTPITATAGGVSSSAFTAGLGVLVSNTGATNTAYCAPGSSASTSSTPVLPGQTVQIQTTSETQITCVTSTSTTTVNLQTGNGLATGWGGSGAGGGGGGGAITAASGSYAAGALAAGAFATGSGVDGWDLTQGAKADAAWTTGSGSVISLLKAIAAAEIVTNRAVNLAQLNGVALASPAAYGTAPTGNAIGVNAFVTNTLAPGQAAGSSSSPVVVAKNSGTGSTVAGAAVGTAGSASAEVVSVQGVSGGTPQNVAPQATSTGAATPFKLIAAATNNSTLISTGAHSVYSYQAGSLSASTPYWLKFYDKATAPTCGTDTPIKVILVPPTNSGNNGNIPVGFSVALGLGICVVGGIADSDNTSAAATTVAINVDYK